MSSRHQPEAGADSDYTLRPFRCLVKDVEGPAWWITIPQALGRNDAREQARMKAYDQGAERPGVIEIREVAA